MDIGLRGRTFIASCAVFCIVFLACGVSGAVRWEDFSGMTDLHMWGSQVQYVAAGDERALDFRGAYGHPGGPVIEGGYALSHALAVPYDDGVLMFLVLACAFAVAGICTLGFILRPQTYWWITAGILLSFNWLYEFFTPPSAVASIAVPFLFMLTWFVYERHGKDMRWLALWGCVAGFVTATRLDIGGLASGVFLLALLPRVGIRRAVGAGAIAVLAFCAFDPFMWFMPIAHVQGLLYKMLFHYAEFERNRLPLRQILSISLPAAIAPVIALAALAVPRSLPSPVPKQLVLSLAGMTVLLYGIFLTSRFQAERYFVPIIFVWEMLLPLLLFSLIEMTKISFARSEAGQRRFRIASQIAVTAVLLIPCYLVWIFPDLGSTLHLFHEAP